jgi:hypothetical protein
LVPENASHEYACGSPLVKLTLDEDERFCSPCDVSDLHLIGEKLSFDKPLKDRKMPVGIFKVQVRRLFNLHDFWPFNVGRLLPICSHRGRVFITRKDPMRHRLST